VSEPPGRQVPGIGTEDLDHEIAHDDRHPEREQDGREGVGPGDHAVDEHGLQPEAQGEGDDRDGRQQDERMHARHDVGQGHTDERAEDDELAV
jgi:hypothetical protein